MCDKLNMSRKFLWVSRKHQMPGILFPYPQFSGFFHLLFWQKQWFWYLKKKKYRSNFWNWKSKTKEKLDTWIIRFREGKDTQQGGKNPQQKTSDPSHCLMRLRAERSCAFGVGGGHCGPGMSVVCRWSEDKRVTGRQRWAICPRRQRQALPAGPRLLTRGSCACAMGPRKLTGLE